jgi:2,3-bisphosphoglycerate-dependent phosphoglycerate mutase
MARLIVALIRHGDYAQLPNTPSAHQPFALTTTGESQSRLAGTRLREIIEQNHWRLDTTIDSSQLLRAWQTAQLILETLAPCVDTAQSVECFDALAERGVGSVANLSIGQIEDIVSRDPRFPELPADWKANSHYKLPFQGAESLHEAGQRVAGHLTQCMANLQQVTNVDTLKLFVGHGAAFRHAAYHLDVLRLEQVPELSMYHASPIFLEYMPDGRWSHVSGEWKVRPPKEECLD